MKEIAGPELTITYHLAICVSKRVGSRGGSAGIRNLYSYVISSGDIRYITYKLNNRSYAAVVYRQSTGGLSQRCPGSTPATAGLFAS